MIMGDPIVERQTEMRCRGALRLIWALLADSERVDRAMGALPSTYTLTPQWGDLGMLRVGHADSGLGSWTETGSWSEGRFFEGERTHSGPMVATVRYKVDLEEEGDGAKVTLSFCVKVRAEEGRPIAEVLVEMAMRRLVRLVEAADKLLLHVVDEPERAALRVLEPYLLRENVKFLFRRPQVTAEGAVASGLALLEEFGVTAAVREALGRLLLLGPDEMLSEVRPRLFSRAFGLPERDVLVGCVEAVRAGLLVLEWRPICSACRGPTTAKAALSKLGNEASCLACALNTPIDAASTLEAVFCVSPAVRKVERHVHCASGLTFRPWLLAGGQVGPGDFREVSIPAVVGGVEIGLRGQTSALAVLDEGASEEVVVAFDEEGRVSVKRKPSDKATLRVENASAGQAEVEVRRRVDDPERTLAIDLFALPAFRDVFAGDRPDPKTSLSVGRVAVMFADLAGSAAAYNTLGDGPAFALVERYFGAMRAVVERSGGAVVKTMGDAILSVFADGGKAIEAAFALHEASFGLLHGHGLALRVGLNEGPCLAIDANNVLDYFGVTVNLAARLQSQAAAEQTMVSASIADTYKERLSGAIVNREEIVLKGFSGPVSCLRIKHEAASVRAPYG